MSNNASQTLSAVATSDTLNAIDLGLRKALARIQSLRRRQAKTHLELLKAVRDVAGKSIRQRRSILIEAGLGAQEASRLLKSSKADLGLEALLIREACSPDVIDAIVSSRDDVKHFAVRRLEAGHAVERRDLTRLRNAIAASKPGAEYRHNARLVADEARRAASSRLLSFREQVKALIQAMLALHDAHALEDAAVQAITDLAGDLLNQLPLFFDMEHINATRNSLEATDRIAQAIGRLDPTRDHDQLKALAKRTPKIAAGDARLAEAVTALTRLSIGDFWRVENADLDFDRNIEFELIRRTAWLAGDDLSAVERAMDDRRYQGEAGYSSREPEPLISLEFCAGAGGEAIGLHAAGFKPVGVFESNKAAVDTLVGNNIFGPLHCVDIKTVNFDAYAGKIDVIAGGVPCQPYSSSGHRKREEDERDLFMHVAEIVEQVRPKALMLENVSGFAHEANSHYRADITARLQAAGYDTRLIALKASDYGLAQHRPRCVLLAFRDGYMARFRLPPIFPEWNTTVGDALMDLVSCNGWQGSSAWALKAGRPGPTLTGASQGKVQGFAAFNQVVDWEKLEVSARDLAKRSPEHDDALDTMPGLTLRMGARLQGFPDTWRFQGTEIEQRCQIANAFPPIMAAAVGLAIREALTGIRQDYRGVLERLRFLRARDSRSDTDFLANKASCGEFGSWYYDHERLSEITERALGLGLPLGDILAERRRHVPEMQTAAMRRHFGKVIPALHKAEIADRCALPEDWFALKNVSEPALEAATAPAA